MGSYSPMPEPERLPPGVEMPPPQQAVRKPRSSWATAPATYLLVGINCAVFLAMVGSGVSIGSPTTDQLMHWGANNAGSVLINGEWIRIVTAMFVHVGILHLATNMWCLWNLGLLAEPLMGSFGVLAVYILTGAAGNLVATDIHSLWPRRDVAGGVVFAGGGWSVGSRFWNCRSTDRAAEVEPAAGASCRVEKAAQVGDLFRSA